MGAFTPVALLGGLVALTYRGVLGFPLAALLAVVWITALKIGPPLPVGAVVALAECALWMELAEVAVATGEKVSEAAAAASLHGFLGGLVGGLAAEAVGGFAGIPLAAAFVGAALAAGVATSAAEGLRAATRLPEVSGDLRLVQGGLAAGILAGLMGAG